MSPVHWALRGNYSDHIVLLMLSYGGSLDLKKRASWRSKKPLNDFNPKFRRRLEAAKDFRQVAQDIMNELNLKFDFY